MEQYSVEELRDMLKDKGIQPSFHRIHILKYLLENKSHPTVDEIFQKLSGEIPTLSKTTVYNTLNLFAEKGLVEVLTIDEREARFDVIVKPHAHFKCLKCGAIYDFWEVDVKIKDKEFEKFTTKSMHLYVKGYCPNCQ
ncbi:Fur family transcriptional regulator, peroxide stress response regulator [Thermosulfidibacter takaii ABI70S6]|uniref:Ferric uptake regulation protein n=1 Tax=Thermosulfidibacter takaii (strain DSM 17441 / JCM 13301 / NBRC 103674 / ABI70S6) TaxID=1298851 RepID=A0A0S3QT81_THET7|nr:Fur family transcriptional regulator [Thermosulfidibacter takaii]BAT71516.1 Fur family transcriptional regulator, peroxide stress response regulator [Thermosulfidibacter takaii ABI70S6]